ncbi:MAG: hypothetical protein IGR93_22625 [Hydrococcus sp. C42_A2020_068]|nr:hypothetical protein [Hydrococcus sp. C42_A2020_068]
MKSEFGSILDFVRSRSHPTSVGIGLDPEMPANGQRHEHVSYRVTAKTRLDNIDV